MDWVYQYRDPDRLYLNVTNRCSNRCTFCVRSRTARLGDGRLLGGDEPDLDSLLAAVEDRGGAARYHEIVWCGYGEPTIRLDLITGAAPVLRGAGAAVRLNTNGHGCLIHGRDILPELDGIVDRVNVSLNAPDEARYLELCRPDPSAVPGSPAPAAFWPAVLDFLARAPTFIPEVQASVVGHALSHEDIERSRGLATELGCRSFRVR